MIFKISVSTNSVLETNSQGVSPLGAKHLKNLCEESAVKEKIGTRCDVTIRREWGEYANMLDLWCVWGEGRGFIIKIVRFNMHKVRIKVFTNENNQIV